MRRWAPHPLNLRQLQYALAVAELRSFRKAAEACAVAQPSLSQQIAQLESTLGVRLFERLPRGVLVTEAGAAVLERAQQALLHVDDLVQSAERLREPFAGTLRVGVIPTVAPYLLPEIAPQLRSAYPRLSLLWEEDKTHVLLDKLGTGELDAGILALGTEGFEELEHVVVGRDAFYLVAPRDHELARHAKKPLRLDALDGESVLLLDDGHCFRDQALSVCQRVGAAEASVRATSISTLAQMVAGGIGITLLPGIALRTENRARSLAVRSFGARGPARTLVLAWRKTSPGSATWRKIGATVSDSYRLSKSCNPSIGDYLD
ncbi:MAG TPA: LysR substrate-binding domain-containing protein [Polyangiaceae bacterium]|nr:LysR substrate-binding domain-containing protein [Polyangiaceae bacterium]